jgi:hypothetical protein
MQAIQAISRHNKFHCRQRTFNNWRILAAPENKNSSKMEQLCRSQDNKLMDRRLKKKIERYVTMKIQADQ